MHQAGMPEQHIALFGQEALALELMVVFQGFKQGGKEAF